MSVEHRRGTSRFVSEGSGIRTRHSFSFGQHYDPANTGFGPLALHDHHVLEPGRGFERHRHVGVEIVTWVLAGGLVHDGDRGPAAGSLAPGQVAVQSAGSGVEHSEVADDRGCGFVQAWLRPDHPGGTPARRVTDVAVAPGVLTPVVGPSGPATVGVAGARLDVARLRPGDEVVLPAAPRAHLYVATGAVACADLPLTEGDALRLVGEPALTLAATSAAEVLLWRFRA